MVAKTLRAPQIPCKMLYHLFAIKSPPSTWRPLVQACSAQPALAQGQALAQTLPVQQQPQSWQLGFNAEASSKHEQSRDLL